MTEKGNVMFNLKMFKHYKYIEMQDNSLCSITNIAPPKKKLEGKIFSSTTYLTIKVYLSAPKQESIMFPE